MQKDDEVEIEVLGFWWVIGHSDDKWPGLLKFSKKDGAILKIFQNEKHNKFQYKKTYDIIVGIAENRKYTLYKCFQISNMQRQIKYYTFKSDTLIRANESILLKEDIQFTGMNSIISNTDAFFRTFSSFQVEYNPDELEGDDTVIKYNPQQITFAVDDKLVGRVISDYEVTYGQPFTIEPFIIFRIATNDNSLVPLELLVHKMDSLRIFFSLIFQGICNYEEQYLTTNRFDGSIELSCRNNFGISSRRFRMFNYEDVDSKMNKILENWYRIYLEIPEVINLFYNSYTADRFYEYHFRETYIALEGMYKWKLKTNVSKGNLIPGLIKPLKERLVDIPEFVKIIENNGKWGDIARKNRVLQTHLYEGDSDDLLDTNGLILSMRKIQAVILFYILEELGFSDTEINSVFERLEGHFNPFFF